MRLPAAHDLLDAWERGLSQPPLVRAMLLLASACPEDGIGELADLPLGERDRRLLDLREGLFGVRLTAMAACPACGEQHEAGLGVGDIRGHGPGPVSGCCELGRYAITFRLPTTTDLMAVLGAPQPERRKLLLKRCLTDVRDGEEPVRAEALPSHVADEIDQRMAAADPQADVELGFSCSSCRHEWSARFDITSYLWQELEAWALRTLRDVASLARAFGWREAEVLALSPTRRRLYMELCGT